MVQVYIHVHVGHCVYYVLAGTLSLSSSFDKGGKAVNDPSWSLAESRLELNNGRDLVFIMYQYSLELHLMEFGKHLLYSTVQ